MSMIYFTQITHPFGLYLLPPISPTGSTGRAKVPTDVQVEETRQFTERSELGEPVHYWWKGVH